MNQLLVLAYTVGGGVVGAGLNQYVTNIGQRRTARATVVGKVSQVESIYAQIRWPGDEAGDGDVGHKSHLELEQYLNDLEGAGLVAGIPRSTLYAYIRTCRMSDTLRNARSISSAIASELENIVKPRLRTYINSAGSGLDDPNVELAVQTAEELDKLIQKIRSFIEVLKEGEKGNFDDHDAASDALISSLWHPLINKFRWREHWRLRQMNEKDERVRRHVFAEMQGFQTPKDRLVELVNRLPAGTTGKPETKVNLAIPEALHSPRVVQKRQRDESSWFHSLWTSLSRNQGTDGELRITSPSVRRPRPSLGDAAWSALGPANDAVAATQGHGKVVK